MRHAYTLLLFLSISITGLHAQSPSELPLFDIQKLTYEGAFRIDASRQGVSDINYSEGPIAFNPDNNSLFIVGHAQQQAVAEYAIPTVVKSGRLADLNTVEAPLQVFNRLLTRTPDDNPQSIDRIGGMYYVNSGSGRGKLVVNAYEYYDAAGSNTQTTLVVEDADDLAGSSVKGYLRFEGGAGHTSGWMSPIPQAWQSSLGGSHLTGQSSGIPIISRTSVGPSAFAFDVNELLATTNQISTTALLDFSLGNPLNKDLSNQFGDNDIWTHLSRVTYGFIVPGTRTYLTLGNSGGHESGVCYKCAQDNGNVCGGYCPPVATDTYQYYWLWDVNDLLAVKAGTLQPHEVRPYDYGKFSTPFQADGTKEIGGGSFNPATGELYLSVKRGDTEQGTYATPPVIVVYKTNSAPATEPTVDNPAETTDAFWLEAECATTDQGWQSVGSSSASAQQYLVYTGPRSISTPSAQNPAKKIDFYLDIPEAGDYQVYLRLNAPDGGRNSFWVRFDDKDWVKMWKNGDNSQLDSKGFEWKRVNNDGALVTFSLSSGRHTLTIANRESGTELDRVLVTNNSTPPTGEGPAATNCGNGLAQRNSVALDRSRITETGVSLFPNPAADELTLQIDNDYTGPVQLRIVDVNGRLVQEVQVEKATEVLLRQLDVREIPSGVYRLQMIEGARQSVSTFIKR